MRHTVLSAQRRLHRLGVEALEGRYVLDSTVVFNELLYHGEEGNGQEWIELHNQMAVDMDVSGWSIRGGVTFAFPASTVIPGGGYLVVAKDPAALMAATGLEGVLGPFDGRLANEGEIVQLVNNSDRVMDALDYNDRDPWPVGADGSGATLSKRHAGLASDDVSNWTTSEQLGGTPGRSNFPTGPAPRVSADLITARTAASFHVPIDARVADDWIQPTYVPGSRGETWTAASTSVGYEQAETVSYEATVLADDPLAYWRMNESSTAQNAVNLGRIGSSANGTYSSRIVLGQPSLVNDANDFSVTILADDPSAAITTAGFPKFMPVDGIGGSGRSIEFWLSLETLPNSIASLVGDGEGALDFGLLVYLTAAGNLEMLLRTSLGENFGITTVQTQRALGVGQRTHVVAAWDQASGQLAMYLDGQPAATTTIEGPLPNPGAPRNTDNAFFIGRDRRNTGTFQAKVDEVAVYNYALSPVQAAAHFGAGGQSLSNLIQTDVAQSMQSIGSSAYLRVPFTVPADLDVDQLSLTMRYDDGFVAYLNGVEIARRNAPEDVQNHQSRATRSRSLGQVLASETIDLSASLDLLRPGDNLLAIHGLNITAGDATFLIEPRLRASGFPRAEDELPAVAFNEISSAQDAVFRFELTNDGTRPVSLKDLLLIRDGGGRERVRLPAVDLSASGYFVLDETQLGFSPESGDRLYLLTPDGKRLIDARPVTDRLTARSALHDNEWLTPSAATFGGANQFEINDQIVINEIMYHAPPVSYAQPDQGTPYVESQEEWIELYNRGTTTVDLSGWQLVDAIRFEFPSGTQLGPDEYLVVAGDAAQLRARYPNVASRIVGDFDGQLNDRHERVRLVDRRSNPVDEVHYYDGGRWPEFADGRGASLELIDPLADNSIAEAWAASDESRRSTWQTYSYRGPAVLPARSNFPSTFNEFSFGLLDAGEILIDDVRVVEDPDGQALPFIQNSEFESGLDTWRPVGNHRGSVVADPEDPTNRVFHLVATGPEEHLQNHVETTLKQSNTFARVRRGAEYAISFRAKWLGGSPQLNTRLFFNYLPRTTILTTPTQHGTPGAENSRRVANAGPTYQGLQHQPIIPQGGEDVTVTITAADADGVSEMSLWYSVDGGAFLAVPMTTAGGGRYVGTIPGQPEGHRVQLYVRGVDQRGAGSTFPAGGPESRAMYWVGQRPRSTTRLHNLHIIMTATDEDLLGQPTNLMSNDLLGATVVYEDQVFYDVGVRLKGSEHGRPDPNRRGLSVHFHPDRLFRGVHETIGIDRSGGWRFGRTFGQDEILIYQFFNRAGQIPSMYSDLVFVDGPAVRPGTAILQLARYNDAFLDSQFTNGSDGTVYEYELIYAMQESRGRESLKAAQEGPSVVGIPVGTDLGDDKEAYRHYFLIKNNRQRDDYGPMVGLARALSQRTGEFDLATQQVLDVDQWLRAFAALSLSGAGDNYNAGSQHNAIFYQRPSDGKMLLLPFDMDFAFVLSPTAPLSSNTDLTRLRRNPNNEHAFLGHLHDIISTSFNGDYMQRWVEHFDQLLPNQGLRSILSWIEQRAAFVRRQLPAEVEFEITSPDPTLAADTVTLEGRGWINVRQLRLPGSTVPLPVQWLDSTHWQVTIPLTGGQQQLTLEAYDFRGNRIGSDTINITGTRGDFDANGRVDAADIDLLCRQIRLGTYDPRFDLIADGIVDTSDFQRLIREVLKTTAGDANLDGVFDSSDLVQVFRAGKYEDGVPLNTGWAEGDWNCDGEFSTSDLVDAFRSGGYVSAAAAHRRTGLNPIRLSSSIASGIDALMAEVRTGFDPVLPTSESLLA